MANDDQIPDANTDPNEQPVEVPELRLGDPFAMSFDADLVDSKAGGGCTAILQCECGQKFRIDLLAAGVKFCPKCKAGFTHALLVAPTDNTELVAAAMQQVLISNGLREADPEDEDDDDEDDGESEGEDEGEGEGDGNGE